MSRELSLIKNTAIFAVGNVGSKLLVLLLLPICTYFIDPSGVGVYDLLYSLLEVLKPVAVLAIPESLFRWLLDKDANRRGVFASWTPLFVVLLLAFTFLYVAVWSLLRFNDAALVYALIVSGVVYMSLQFATRGLHNNKLFAIQGIVYSIALCSASLLFVIPLGLDYRGMLLGILVGNLVSSVLMIVIQRKDFKFSFKDRNLAQSKEMLRYSALLLPNSLCWWLINGFSRVLVVGVLGLAANGVFAIAARFPTALTMLSNIFQQAWTEQAVGEFDATDRNEYFTKIFRLYSRIVLSIAIVLIPFTKLFIDLFLDSGYTEACNYIGLLYLSGVFNAFSSFFGTGYFCGKDTKGAASTTVVGALVSCGLSVALIFPFGLLGVVVGMLAGQMTMWMVRIRQSSSYFMIHIDWVQIVIGVVICLLFSGAVIFVSDQTAVALLFLGAVVAVLLSWDILKSAFRKCARFSRE